ncbi:MAG: hypothetical protein WA941_00020 [Nitrososphaeraceae archaeon]|jgi:hypothetical protein
MIGIFGDIVRGIDQLIESVKGVSHLGPEIKVLAHPNNIAAGN